MDTAEKVDGLIDSAVQMGAKVTTGGAPKDSTVMPPTIVDHVTDAMPLFTEESFGPVVCVIRARDTDHAVELANTTEYGLSSAVFGSDITRALDVADRLSAGICHINGPTVQDEAQMPFGGVKDSGYGRFGGVWSVAEFTELRWITVQDGTPHYPI